MTREYKIEWKAPDDFDPGPLLGRLPSPIARGPREIYNYSVDADGFCFIDREVDPRIAGQAFKEFVDGALRHSNVVTIKAR